MSILSRSILAACLLQVPLAADAAPQRQAKTAQAQAAQGSTPNALQGFSKNQNQPIAIESQSLEVRDKDKVATFIDNVKVVQGDTTLECKRLVVHYDGDTAGQKAGAKPAPQKGGLPPPPTGQQQISRLEAKGGVVVTQKDQVAVGDNGVYDMKTNTMVLTGNVVLTQGPNVVRGDRLVVNMTTGQSTVDSSRAESGPNSPPGRVRALFNPSSREALKPAEEAKPADAGKPGDATGSTAGAKSAEKEKDKSKHGATRPLRLN